MRSEQFERLLADMTDQELDALKEWNSGCYWGNKSAIDLINAELCLVTWCYQLRGLQ